MRGVAAHYKPAETPSVSKADTVRVLAMLGEGKTFQQIADAIGTRRWNIQNWVYRYENEYGRIPRPGRGNPQVIQQHLIDDQDDTSGDRCRCGLRLPCNQCIQPLHMFATERRDR